MLEEAYLFKILFPFSVIMEFITLHKRIPNPAHRAEDEVELLTIKNALLEKMGIPQEKVDNQFARYVLVICLFRCMTV